MDIVFDLLTIHFIIELIKKHKYSINQETVIFFNLIIESIIHSLTHTIVHQSY
jgi:hypothetical protein